MFSEDSQSLTALNLCQCEHDRVVQFQCLDEDMMFCKPCKNTFHRNCNVQNILQTSKGILSNPEFRKLTKELKVLRSVYVKMMRNQDLESIQRRQERKCNSASSKHRRNIKGFVNARQSGQNFVSVAFSRNNNIERALKSKSGIERIDYYLQELTGNILAQNHIGAFIAYHRAKYDLAGLYGFINDMNGNKKQDYHGDLTDTQDAFDSITIANNIKLDKDLLESPTEGQKSLRGATYSGTPTSGLPKKKSRAPRLNSGRWRFKPLFRPQAIRMATNLSSVRCLSKKSYLRTTSYLFSRQSTQAKPEELSVRGNDELDFENQVTAMVCVRDGRFVVLDCRGNKVKLFSTDNRYLSEMSLHCSLWDCTVVGNLVLVTCPAEGKIQKIQLTSNNRMFETGIIITQKDCKAICFYNHRIYVTFTGLCPCIKILSQDGIMYRCIDARQGRLKIFQNPLYMHVARTGKAIYLSDFTLQKLVVIDHKGRVLHELDVRPNWPLGITVDKDENVILAVTGDNKVIFVKAEGYRMQTLIPSKKLNGDPCSVMSKCEFEGQRLYVAFAGKSVVKIFHLM